MEEENDSFEENTSTELARLAQETIAAQSASSDMAQTRIRCQRVIDLYARGDIQDGQDYFHAALILLYGETLAHFELARTFARRSTELGDTRAWTVLAMSWDRLLLAQKKPQRFGTQIIKKDGIWSLGTVDASVNDNERAMYGVPPLYVQRQRAEQLQRQENE